MLAKMVKEVMMENDSVTLPGVGSFQAELVPASITDRGYTIQPPYRRLYFTPRQGSDSLLASFYAASNDISEADATRILVDFLDRLKTVLMTRKTLVLPGLGKLRATRENHFFFVPDEDLDIYPEGFCLEPISMKKHKESQQEVATAVANLAGMLSPEPQAAAPSEPVIDMVLDVEPAPAEVPSEPEPAEVPSEPIPAEVSSEPILAEEPVQEQAEEASFVADDKADAPQEASPVLPDAPVEEESEEVLPDAPVEEEPEEVLPDAPVEEESAGVSFVAENEADAPQETPAVSSETPLAVEEPEPKPEPVPEPEVEPEPEAKKKSHWFLWTLLVLLIVVVLAAAGIAVLGRVAPEWLDQFLYSAEELEVLYPEL